MNIIPNSDRHRVSIEPTLFISLRSPARNGANEDGNMNIEFTLQFGEYLSEYLNAFLWNSNVGGGELWGKRF